LSIDLLNAKKILVANAVETQPFHQRAAETEDDIRPAEIQSRKLI